MCTISSYSHIRGGNVTEHLDKADHHSAADIGMGGGRMQGPSRMNEGVHSLLLSPSRCVIARAASDESTMVDKMSVLSDLPPWVGLIRSHIP